MEPFKLCFETLSETADFDNQYSKVHIDIKNKDKNSAQEKGNVERLTIQPDRIKKQIKYVCEHCRRAFSYMGNLKRHIHTHIHSKKNIKNGS